MTDEGRPTDSSAAELRKRAEMKARREAAQPGDLLALSPEETPRILHDLRVHQIELEMQNEELRSAQIELDASRARYFDLYELAPVGYCTVSEKGLILEANLTAATLLSVSRDALVKQAIFRFILPEDQDIFYRHRKQLLETGEPQKFELRMLGAKGAPFWVQLDATAAQDESGAPVSRVVLVDVSERKRAEEDRRKLQMQLIRAQQMESVGRLAGGVAHDFNNMLGVIIGNAELAMERVTSDDPLHDALRAILNAAGRCAAVTRQLLGYARKQMIMPEEIDLNTTIEGMLQILRRFVGERIDVCWVPAANVWSVRVDPLQIDQILVNLCSNAREAIDDVGKITIETGAVTFDENYCSSYEGFVPGDYVFLAVSNDGCGMERQTLDNLFEPFFTTSDVGKGTGLGLATTYGIVQQNGGFMSVSSEPGEGTTFRIYLPRCERVADSLLKKKDPMEPAKE